MQIGVVNETDKVRIDIALVNLFGNHVEVIDYGLEFGFVVRLQVIRYLTHELILSLAFLELVVFIDKDIARG